MSISFQSARSPASERRELAHRSGAGVDVTLYWQPILDELLVCVRDERHGAHFEIRPPHNRALDVYNHPYAYAKESRRAA